MLQGDRDVKEPAHVRAREDGKTRCVEGREVDAADSLGKARVVDRRGGARARRRDSCRGTRGMLSGGG